MKEGRGGRQRGERRVTERGEEGEREGEEEREGGRGIEEGREGEKSLYDFASIYISADICPNRGQTLGGRERQKQIISTTV